MKKIYLLRHGQSKLDGRYVGSIDCGLSGEGIRQVKEKGEALKNIAFNRAFVSPMRRCLESLDLLKVDCPVETLSQLKEIDFGDWEGKTFLQIYDENKSLVEQWNNEPLSFTFPSGESISEFIGRVKFVYDHIVREPENDVTILIVSHGGVIRFLLCLLLGLNLKDNEKFNPETGSYTVLEYYNRDSVVLKAFNK